MTQEFVHLRLHSEYSLVDGLVRLKPLAQKVAELKMPAVALTDFNNFFGLASQRVEPARVLAGTASAPDNVAPDEHSRRLGHRRGQARHNISHRIRKAQTGQVQPVIRLGVVIDASLIAQGGNAGNAELFRDKDQCPRFCNAAKVIVHEHDGTCVAHVTLGTILQMGLVLAHSVNG